MDYEVKYIRPGSIFKVVFWIYLFVYLSAGTAVLLISSVIGNFFITLITAIAGSIIGAALTAFISVICGLIYNIISEKVGGIVIHLKKND